MAPSFDTLSEHDLHEEEDEEVDFSGECDVVFRWSRPLFADFSRSPFQISRRSTK